MLIYQCCILVKNDCYARWYFSKPVAIVCVLVSSTFPHFITVTSHEHTVCSTAQANNKKTSKLCIIGASCEGITDDQCCHLTKGQWCLDSLKLVNAYICIRHINQATLLLIGPSGTNVSEILIEMQIFLSKEMHSKVAFVRWQPFCLGHNVLTHWGRVTHICIGKLTIIGSDNGLSPGRGQAIIYTNAGLLLIGPLGTNFSEILIKI